MTKLERKDIIKKAAVKAQSSNTAKRDFTAHLVGGNSGVNLKQTITLGADVDSAISSVPKQVRLLCQYLAVHGNSATFEQLNQYADKAVGVEYWRRGSTAYEQSVAKIASHYMDKLLGNVAWSDKLGKQEIICLVK